MTWCALRRFACRWRSVSMMLGLAAAAGCTTPQPHPPAAGPAQVLVARRGWHIDVGFEKEALPDSLGFISPQFPGARYVFFGFGDERYVRSATHRWPALLAAVWPGRGVMLVTALDNTPDEAFGTDQVVRIPVTAAQREAVAGFIAASFKHAAGNPPLRSGPYADSLYYASSADYSGLHTCNTWAAESLRRGDLPVHSQGVLWAGQLWRQVRPLDRADAP